MKFLFKLLGKFNTLKLLEINKGYNILKDSEKLDFLDNLKAKITQNKLFDNTEVSFFNSITTDVDIEISARQYIISRYIGIDFNRKILRSISNSDYKFTHPIPFVWLDLLQKNGIKVNFVSSLFLWHLELFKLFLFGFFEFFRQIYYAILNLFTNHTIYNKKFVYFDLLSASNIPNISGYHKHGILSWFTNKYGATNIDIIAHSVKNSNDILLNESVEVKFLNFPFPPPISLIILIKFFYLTFFKFSNAIYQVFTGKWWSILMLREYILYEIVRLNKGKGLGEQYFFHNSSWLYRPLWTHAAAKNGAKIVFYFYSTNIERFKKFGKKTTVANSWEIITWSKILVWDIYQYKFIKDNVINKSNEIDIVGPIDFQSSNNHNVNLPDNSIVVFDVQPVRDIYYISLGLDQEYYVPAISNNFLNHVISAINNVGLNPVFKRKREIGKLAHFKYINYLNTITNQYNIINLDPSIPAELIILKSKAVISMPFTSTALVAKHLGKPSVFYDPTGLIIKDDPAAHGIMIINNKIDLQKWLSKL